MICSNGPQDYPIPPELDGLLMDTAIPVTVRMRARLDIEEHVELLKSRGEFDRIDDYYDQMTEEFNNEVIEGRRRNRRSIALEVVQRVVIPAATSLGVVLLQASGHG